MADVASLELCKELYKLSGWETEGTGQYVRDREDQGNTFFADEGDGMGVFERVCPAYDLGYLVRKLPERYELSKNVGVHGKTHWGIYPQPVVKDLYEGLYVIGDTPEDAACKLAIQLFKEGILTKEEV